MPIRGSPNGARHTRPQPCALVAIARNRWSPSIGTVVSSIGTQVAITRCAQANCARTTCGSPEWVKSVVLTVGRPLADLPG